jgi:hypothetical protein
VKKLCKSAACTFLVATLLALNTYALPANAAVSNNVCKGASNSQEKKISIEEQVTEIFPTRNIVKVKKKVPKKS